MTKEERIQELMDKLYNGQISFGEYLKQLNEIITEPGGEQ